MRNDKIARPYARALFSLAQSEGQEEQVALDLAKVLEVWHGQDAWQRFMRRPEVSAKAKRETFQRIFSESLGKVCQNFVQVVIAKGREEVLPDIDREYRHLYDVSRGVVHVDVETAHALSDEEEQGLTEALAKATGRTVKLSLKAREELLAGVIVRMGDRVLDGSLTRRLTILGDRLKSGERGR